MVEDHNEDAEAYLIDVTGWLPPSRDATSAARAGAPRIPASRRLIDALFPRCGGAARISRKLLLLRAQLIRRVPQKVLKMRGRFRTPYFRQQVAGHSHGARPRTAVLVTGDELLLEAKSGCLNDWHVINRWNLKRRNGHRHFIDPEYLGFSTTIREGGKLEQGFHGSRVGNVFDVFAPTTANFLPTILWRRAV